MKKLIKVLVVLMVGLSSLATGVVAFAQEDIMTITREAGYTVDEKYRPKTSIMIDSQTGRVIWEDNADVQRYIASLTKLMTLYLGFEAIEAGKFSLETTLQPSQNVLNISNIYSLSNNKMAAGVEYTIEDIIHLVLIPSSNAATVMLANLVSDDNAASFVNLMNEKAKELGMTNTIYYNATGAASSFFEGYYLPEGIDPNGDNMSTARDLSILAFNMLKKYPQVLEFTKNPTYTVKPGTPYEETFDSYLFALPGKTYAYEGFDGIKTGSSPSAAFGFVGTAKRQDTRFIEVILGVGDWSDQIGEEERHPFGNALLDLGFNGFEYKKVLDSGEQTINDQQIVLEQDFYTLVPKNQELSFKLENNQLSLVTDLPQVSDKVPNPSVSYQVVAQGKNLGKPTADKGDLKPTDDSSFFSQIDKYAIPALVTLIGLIVVVVSRLQRKPKRGSRHSAKSSMGKITLIVGLIITAAGIGFGVLVNLNLL
ncbi:D-alanyl-D-alanine carboxypeptidase [Vagococcus sp. BWB3-3]|uniref:D-alanyl-D-alanine carboxypeptidase n=1 Tax=Vagococcus allomyrinae TaxID=2794353 RepID=A0A940P3Q3_9ENTE|nr:DUF1958 domain-containing protein [Vagococcus allomyrinae]MBP1040460.1 D-alanyl-D-alanine carboxypeptidase [Vagococcus allomyrinae]